MNTTFMVVAIFLVVFVLALGAWTFVIAPFFVPWHHAKH